MNDDICKDIDEQTARACTKTSCSWVSRPYDKPIEVLITQGEPRKGIIFGRDSGNEEIVCVDGDHPLLFSHEIHRVVGES